MPVVRPRLRLQRQRRHGARRRLGDLPVSNRVGGRHEIRERRRQRDEAADPGRIRLGDRVQHRIQVAKPGIRAPVAGQEVPQQQTAVPLHHVEAEFGERAVEHELRRAAQLAVAVHDGVDLVAFELDEGLNQARPSVIHQLLGEHERRQPAGGDRNRPQPAGPQRGGDVARPVEFHDDPGVLVDRPRAEQRGDRVGVRLRTARRGQDRDPARPIDVQQAQQFGVGGPPAPVVETSKRRGVQEARSLLPPPLDRDVAPDQLLVEVGAYVRQDLATGLRDVEHDGVTAQIHRSGPARPHQVLDERGPHTDEHRHQQQSADREHDAHRQQARVFGRRHHVSGVDHLSDRPPEQIGVVGLLGVDDAVAVEVGLLGADEAQNRRGRTREHQGQPHDQEDLRHALALQRDRDEVAGERPPQHQQEDQTRDPAGHQDRLAHALGGQERGGSHHGDGEDDAPRDLRRPVSYAPPQQDAAGRGFERKQNEERPLKCGAHADEHERHDDRHRQDHARGRPAEDGVDRFHKRGHERAAV